MSQAPANCLNCSHHEVISDRDPDDWFCDDDQAVVCTLTVNPSRDLSSKWRSDHSQYQPITRSCRPYNLRRECDRPIWCPKALQGLS